MLPKWYDVVERRVAEIIPNARWIRNQAHVRNCRNTYARIHFVSNWLTLTVDIQQILRKGIALQQAGHLMDAEQHYQQILSVEPDHADSLHLLGVLVHQRGDAKLATELISKAILVNDRVAEFHCNIGAALHDLRRLGEAETHYRRALALNPNLAEAHNNFGNTLKDQGKLVEAEQHCRLALTLRPSYAEAHYNLGNALIDQRRTEEAVMQYRMAVGLNPDFAEAHFNLGNALHNQGKLNEAAACYQQALANKPDWAEARKSLGIVLYSRSQERRVKTPSRRSHRPTGRATDRMIEQAERLATTGRVQKAIEIWRHVCDAEPQQAKHWFGLGLALQRAYRPTDALETYARGHAIDPNFPHLRNNIAAAHIDMGQPQCAVEILEQLVAEGRADALVLINLGSAYRETFQIERSAQAFEQAIAEAPDNALAYNNYGLTLKELGRLDDARAMFARALAIDSNYAGARWNLAMAQLARGDYSRGWTNHEARWDGAPELRGKPRGGLAQPLWEGQPLRGKVLFVWGEQGFGDSLQFVRYLPLVAEQVARECGQLVYCCFAPLLPLFRRSLQQHVGTIVAHDHTPMPPFDYHCPLLSLPLRLSATIPMGSPYLVPDAAKTAAWRGRLAGEQRLKVALVWRGNPTHQRNPFRSVGLEAYTEAFKGLEGVAFYSLQFGASDQIPWARANGLDIVDHTWEMADYDDSAAFLSNMDLIITICTSTAHLAGAIGAPAWVLLDANPHWVWLRERADSPWYPTLTLYRQEAYRDWSSVMASVRSDLLKLASEKKPISE
jgi:tetratricopeptide (TPR) repeat protein